MSATDFESDKISSENFEIRKIWRIELGRENGSTGSFGECRATDGVGFRSSDDKARDRPG